LRREEMFAYIYAGASIVCGIVAVTKQRWLSKWNGVIVRYVKVEEYCNPLVLNECPEYLSLETYPNGAYITSYKPGTTTSDMKLIVRIHKKYSKLVLIEGVQYKALKMGDSYLVLNTFSSSSNTSVRDTENNELIVKNSVYHELIENAQITRDIGVILCITCLILAIKSFLNYT